MQKIFRLPEQGLEVEIGKYARQADGSVWIKSGNTVILATAVAAKGSGKFLGFFPLTVESDHYFHQHTFEKSNFFQLFIRLMANFHLAY